MGPASTNQFSTNTAQYSGAQNPMSADSSWTVGSGIRKKWLIFSGPPLRNFHPKKIMIPGNNSTDTSIISHKAMPITSNSV